MTRKVLMITGAGRGLGHHIAKAALEAGHAVVATGRSTDAIEKAFGDGKNLLIAQLDITNAQGPYPVVEMAVNRFGRIDVLVNSAANFYAGFFEELTPQEIDLQLSTSLLGPMNLTRAVLPLMRKQHSGHIISISSSVGLTAGYEFMSAYAASKFGLEGWMESLTAEVAPFGIHTTTVNPGFFRTELLTPRSMNYAEARITDYDERRAQLMTYWNNLNGQQPGDPVKLANALMHIIAEARPPRRFVAGSDAVAAAEQKIVDLKAQIEAYRALSSSLALDEEK